MISQRVGVAAMRSAAKPSMYFNQTIPRLALAARLSTSSPRPVATAKLNPTEGHEILVKQRLNRPVSPNLGIYKIDQVWLSDSAWTRITGCALSGASYAFFSAYLVAPLFGWHLESASVAAFFADLPFAIQSGVKFALSYPFAYHFINGVRHLVNDLGAGYAKSSLDTTKYVVWGSAAAAALGLTFAL